MNNERGCLGPQSVVPDQSVPEAGPGPAEYTTVPPASRRSNDTSAVERIRCCQPSWMGTPCATGMETVCRRAVGQAGRDTVHGDGQLAAVPAVAVESNCSKV